MKKNLMLICVASIVAVIDQITKSLIRANFEVNQTTPVINNFLHITYITNTGTAFGLFKGINFVFILFSILVIFGIFYSSRKIKESQSLMIFSLGLLLGGTVGNLIDRIVYGFVIDFIDFKIWPVFNIADSAVTVSVAFLIVILWRE